MTPEILDLIQTILIALIPILGLFYLPRFIKTIEDRLLWDKALRFASAFTQKYLADDTPISDIIDTVIEELLKVLGKLSVEEATVYANDAVLSALKKNDSRLGGYRIASIKRTAYYEKVKDVKVKL